MTELDLIIDLHKSNHRQGPGSMADTLRALSFLSLPADRPLQIADIGCGTGGQTLTLAQHLTGHITAVDLFTPFLDTLQQKATATADLKASIDILAADMHTLPLAPASLDLIWSEAAIYNIGFEKGIRQWSPLLKPGGYMAISEITWLTTARPVALTEFWQEEYPEITTASTKISQLESHGLIPEGYFILPPASWLTAYYEPLQAGFPAFLEKHQHSALAQKVVADHETEIAFYQTNKAYYSYGFYIARKLL